MSNSNRTQLIAEEFANAKHLTFAILFIVVLVLGLLGLAVIYNNIPVWLVLAVVTFQSARVLPYLAGRWYHARKFAPSFFTMPTEAAWLGKSLTGEIETGIAPSCDPGGTYTLTLQCYWPKKPKWARGDAPGKTVVWSEQQTVTGFVRAGKRGLTLPVSFALPKDGEPSGMGRWCLTATKTMPGVDYAAEFVVPVDDPDDYDDDEWEEKGGKDALALAGSDTPADEPRADPEPTRVDDVMGDFSQKVILQSMAMLVALVAGLVAVSIAYPIVLVFSAVLILVFSIGLLVMIYRFFHTGKFGSSSFEMPKQAAVLGQTLSGEIHAGISAEQNPDGKFRLSLDCQKITRTERRGTRHNSGGSTTTSESLWRREASVKGVSSRDNAGLIVPVSFALPKNGEPTAPKTKGNGVRWLLKITTPVEGLDYLAEFEVPVDLPPMKERRR